MAGPNVQKGVIFVLVLLAANAFVPSLTVVHRVGDSAGWFVPQDINFYDDWAIKQNFVVGDKLAFISSATHNVYEVSAIDAEACDSSDPLDVYVSTSPTVTLSTAGTHAYICSVPGHCLLGMKMIIDVVTTPRFTNSSSPADKTTGEHSTAAPALSTPPAPLPSTAFSLPTTLPSHLAIALAMQLSFL